MSSSLFLKLERAADPGNVERHTWKAEDMAGAVVRHLKQMLSTKQGSSITCPDYGVPDVTHLLHDMTEALAVVQRGLKTSIQLYEPRLKNVQIRHVKNTNSLGQPAMLFEISGHILLSDGRRQAVRVGTAMDDRGNVELEEM
ncbi:MAG: type VI secretion system baseplate subunit TssE [Polyangiaceae bacterium]